MKRARAFFRAFLRALADEYGTPPTHETKITVDVDTDAAEEKLVRLSERVAAIQAQLHDVGRTVNALDWTLSRDRFEA